MESLQTGGRGLTLEAGTSQASSLSLPSFVGTVPPLDKVSTFKVNGGPWLVSNQVLLQTLTGGIWKYIHVYHLAFFGQCSLDTTALDATYFFKRFLSLKFLKKIANLAQRRNSTFLTLFFKWQSFLEEQR